MPYLSFVLEDFFGGENRGEMFPGIILPTHPPQQIPGADIKVGFIVLNI